MKLIEKKATEIEYTIVITESERILILNGLSDRTFGSLPYSELYRAFSDLKHAA